LAGVEEAQRAELRSGFDELGRSLAALDDAFAAEARYAQGLALLRADDALDLRESAAAADAFARAAALAGPGELRLDALYDAGVARLLEGERRYREIPEVSGAAAAPPQPGAPLAPGEEPPDPLPIARGHYMDARARLIERLRADWRDADTRANLELGQRRLAELDMIERQREEDEQEQEQPSDQQQPDEDSQDESEQRDQGDEQQDQQQEPSPEDAEPKDSDSEEQQQEQEEPEEPPPGEPESEDEAGEDDSETEPPPPAQPLDEQMLTQEEVQRLMDRLQQIEQANEKLQELIRQAQRGVVKVEKDW
jgi:hypothetical protein